MFLFCFVFLKVLIIIGSWSENLSIKPICPLPGCPLGMLSCHHNDADQLSNLKKCQDNVLAVTLFIYIYGLSDFIGLVCYKSSWNYRKEGAKKGNEHLFPGELYLHVFLPGTEVPSATNTTAVTESFRPMVHPKWEARSPMKAVSRPIMRMETMKQAQPFQYSVGGTKAKRTFQNTVRKCIT